MNQRCDESISRLGEKSPPHGSVQLCRISCARLPAFAEEVLVIYRNERTLAHDTRRSVWAPVAYDSFQDQKKLLGQH